MKYVGPIDGHDLPQLFYFLTNIGCLSDFSYHGNMTETLGTQHFKMMFLDAAHD